MRLNAKSFDRLHARSVRGQARREFVHEGLQEQADVLDEGAARAWLDTHSRTILSGWENPFVGLRPDPLGYGTLELEASGWRFTADEFETALRRLDIENVLHGLSSDALLPSLDRLSRIHDQYNHIPSFDAAMLDEIERRLRAHNMAGQFERFFGRGLERSGTRAVRWQDVLERAVFDQSAGELRSCASFRPGSSAAESDPLFMVRQRYAEYDVPLDWSEYRDILQAEIREALQDGEFEAAYHIDQETSGVRAENNRTFFEAHAADVQLGFLAKAEEIYLKRNVSRNWPDSLREVETMTGIKPDWERPDVHQDLRRRIGLMLSRSDLDAAAGLKQTLQLTAGWTEWYEDIQRGYAGLIQAGSFETLGAWRVTTGIPLRVNASVREALTLALDQNYLSWQSIAPKTLARIRQLAPELLRPEAMQRRFLDELLTSSDDGIYGTSLYTLSFPDIMARLASYGVLIDWQDPKIKYPFLERGLWDLLHADGKFLLEYLPVTGVHFEAQDPICSQFVQEAVSGYLKQLATNNPRIPDRFLLAVRWLSKRGFKNLFETDVEIHAGLQALYAVPTKNPASMFALILATGVRPEAASKAALMECMQEAIEQQRHFLSTKEFQTARLALGEFSFRPSTEAALRKIMQSHLSSARWKDLNELMRATGIRLDEQAFISCWPNRQKICLSEDAAAELARLPDQAMVKRQLRGWLADCLINRDTTEQGFIDRLKTFVQTLGYSRADIRELYVHALREIIPRRFGTSSRRTFMLLAEYETEFGRGDRIELDGPEFADVDRGGVQTALLPRAWPVNTNHLTPEGKTLALLELIEDRTRSSTEPAFAYALAEFEKTHGAVDWNKPELRQKIHALALRKACNDTHGFTSLSARVPYAIEFNPEELRTIAESYVTSSELKQEYDQNICYESWRARYAATRVRPAFNSPVCLGIFRNQLAALIPLDDDQFESFLAWSLLEIDWQIDHLPVISDHISRFLTEAVYALSGVPAASPDRDRILGQLSAGLNRIRRRTGIDAVDERVWDRMIGRSSDPAAHFLQAEQALQRFRHDGPPARWKNIARRLSQRFGQDLLQRDDVSIPAFISAGLLPEAPVLRRAFIQRIEENSVAPLFRELLEQAGLATTEISPEECGMFSAAISPRNAALVYLKYVAARDPQRGRHQAIEAFAGVSPMCAMLPDLLAVKGPAVREDCCPYAQELEPLLATLSRAGIDLKQRGEQQGFIEYVRRFGLHNLPLLAQAVMALIAVDDVDRIKAADQLEKAALSSRALRDALALTARPGETERPKPRAIITRLEDLQTRLREDVLHDRVPSDPIERSPLAMELFNALIPHAGEYSELSDRPGLIAALRSRPDRLPRAPACLKPAEMDVLLRVEDDVTQKKNESETELKQRRIDQVNANIAKKYREQGLQAFLKPWEDALRMLDMGGDSASWWFGGLAERLVKQRDAQTARLATIQHPQGRAAAEKDLARLSDWIESVQVSRFASEHEPADRTDAERATHALLALQNCFRDQVTGKLERQELLRYAAPEAYGLLLRIMAAYAPRHAESVKAAPADDPVERTEAWARWFREEYLEHFSREDINHRQIHPELVDLMHHLWRTTGTAKFLRETPLHKRGPKHPFMDVLRGIHALKLRRERLQNEGLDFVAGPMRIYPCTGLARVLSGDIANACFHSLRGELAEGKYPRLSALILSLPQTDGKDERIAGSVLLIDTKNTQGERVLVLRGLNPTEALIQRELNPVSVVEVLIDYATQAAEASADEPDPVKEIHLSYDHRGGHSTNREPVFQAETALLSARGWPRSEGLVDEPETNFNGYPIWKKGQTLIVWRAR